MLVAALFLWTPILTGCATNPVTGRQELRLVSDRTANDMGKRAYPQIRQEWGGDFNDPELADYISKVGHKLAKMSQSPRLPYRFKVTNSSALNAVTLPGGKIFITRGLLAEMENEAQLAAVLGHEIGHAVARHGQKAMTWDIVMQTAVIIAASAADSNRTADRTAIEAGMVAANLIRLGYSRKQELQADELGIDYMLKAGYHSDGAIQLQEILAKKEKKNRLLLASLMRSHPVSEARLSHVKWYAYSHEPGTAKYRKGDGFFERRFKEKTKKARRVTKASVHHETALNYFKEKRKELAIEEIEKAIAIAPDYAEFYIFKGDVAASQNDFSAAETAYRKAAEVEPEYYKPHSRLGSLAARQKNDDEVIRHHKKAISLNRNNAVSYIESGYAYANKEDFKNAATMLEVGTSLRPQNVKAITKLGQSYERTERPADAASAYLRAVRAAPNNRSADIARKRLEELTKHLRDRR